MDMKERQALGRRNADQQLGLVEQLTSLRMEQSLSVSDVAKDMDVDPAFVRRFEAGGTNFTMSTLRRYAKAVNAELTFTATARKTPEGVGCADSMTGSATRRR